MRPSFEKQEPQPQSLEGQTTGLSTYYLNVCGGCFRPEASYTMTNDTQLREYNS